MVLLWEASSRSPLSLLLSFLCFFANILLDGVIQTSARVCFGCFATSALVVGTSLERRFFSDQDVDLDALDIAPGVISVLGAAIELVVSETLRPPVRYFVNVTSFSAAIFLALEYYNDGDIAAIWKWWRRRRTKKSYKKVSNRQLVKTRSHHHVEGSFQEKYQVGKRLGSGFFGIVVIALSKSKNEQKDEDDCRCFAAKCINRLKLSPDDELQVRQEAELLRHIKGEHPYIVNIYDFFDEPAHFYIVLELMRGGELFERIFKKEKYFEKDARIVIRTLASALEFLHGNDIVHRDLKPENILLESEASNSRIKLADFGFARRVGNGCTTTCGTPNYVAPELIDGSVYGTSVDIWALGVITYILLAGFPPFYHMDRPKLFKLIRKCEFSFPKSHFSLVSFQAQDFIRKCLTRDVRDRITAEEVLDHPWIQGTARQQSRRLRVFQSERLDAETPAEGTPELRVAHGLIKLFNARQRLRAGILAAMAANRMTEIVKVVKGGK